MVETGGKVKQIGGVARFYIKPALGKVIIRKSGVNRQSSKVIQRNNAARDAWSGQNGCPAQAGGVPWKEFVKALSACARTKGLGAGVAKTREYRMRFNKYVKAPKAPAPAPAPAPT